MFRSVQIFYCSNAELVSTKLKSCPSFSSNLICNFNKALKSDWLLSLVKQCHWLRKRHDLKEKNGVIFELIALMRANDIARITTDFKLDASRTC